MKPTTVAIVLAVLAAIWFFFLRKKTVGTAAAPTGPSQPQTYQAIVTNGQPGGYSAGVTAAANNFSDLASTSTDGLATAITTAIQHDQGRH